jgi:Caspase domain/Effector-associated domain 11
MSVFTQGYALLIGVGNDLPATVKDVEGVESLLLDPLRAAYPRDQVITLTEKNASKAGMLEAFASFPALVNGGQNTDNTVLIYYSGHGWKDGLDKHYLIPNDYKVSGKILSSNLVDCIERINSKRIIVLLDCCFAGEVKEHEPELDQDVELLAKELKQGKGKIVIASSSGDQKSYISKTSKYSNFTEVLLEGLDGRFEDKPTEKFIHIIALVDYVTREVPRREPRQTPQINNASNLTNFPICAFNFEKSKSEPFEGLYPPNGDSRGQSVNSNLNQIKKTAKEKLIQNLANAVQYLESQLKEDSSSKNTLLLMQGELSNLKRQEMLGLMSFDQITLSRNQLRARLLSLIDGVEAEELN